MRFQAYLGFGLIAYDQDTTITREVAAQALRAAAHAVRTGKLPPG